MHFNQHYEDNFSYNDAHHTNGNQHGIHSDDLVKFNNKKPFKHRHWQNNGSKTNNYKNRNHQENNSNTQNNPNFTCKQCDRDFFSEFKFQQHLSEHRTCGIDGCSFTAHEKLVEDHINLQHITGLYDRIKNVQTKEDIDKWREERRRNHACSKGSLERKQKLEEEKEKRGERILKNENKFGRDNTRLSLEKNKNRFGQRQNKLQFNKQPLKNNDRDGGTKDDPKSNDSNEGNLNHSNDKQNKWDNKRPSRDNRNNFNKNRNKKPIDLDIYKPLKPDSDKLDWNGSMFPFRGTKELYSSEDANNGINIEDDEWFDAEDELQSTVLNQNIEEEKPVNLLSSLVGDYGSTDDEAEDEAVQNVQKCNINTTDKNMNISKIVKSELDGKKTNNYCISSDDDDGPPTEEKILIHKNPFEIPEVSQISKPDEPGVSTSSENRRKRSHGRNNKNEKNRPVYFKKRRITLLEKLLDNDIRHERNVLLQCVRYIVKNNFFDK